MSFLTERLLNLSTTYEPNRSEMASLRRLIVRLASTPLSIVSVLRSEPRSAPDAEVQCENDFSRSSFWRQEVGAGLQYLLERVSLPADARRDFMDYFNYDVVPHLGPAPEEFRAQELKPCTFLSDDHTPIEYIWAVDADGKMSIRFAMEPLNALDGTPSSSSNWMNTLQNLRSWHRTKAWSLDWMNICCETLILNQSEANDCAEYSSQFFLGT